jgi:23S rRNA (pseudouridine1915-N3)-methyltransferase
MKITMITVGKKNEAWIEPGVKRFFKRLRGQFVTEMVIIPHSKANGARAVVEESEGLLARVGDDSFVILLDERGKNLSSPELSALITDHSNRHIIVLIGGAYGVNEAVRQRADIIWSLSRLVFPHQLVRLIVAEQLYRAQEIAREGRYHHN